MCEVVKQKQVESGKETSYLSLIFLISSGFGVAIEMEAISSYPDIISGVRGNLQVVYIPLGCQGNLRIGECNLASPSVWLEHMPTV
jgi:hypothetical protein